MASDARPARSVCRVRPGRPAVGRPGRGRSAASSPGSELPCPAPGARVEADFLSAQKTECHPTSERMMPLVPRISRNLRPLRSTSAMPTNGQQKGHRGKDDIPQWACRSESPPCSRMLVLYNDRIDACRLGGRRGRGRPARMAHILAAQERLLNLLAGRAGRRGLRADSSISVIRVWLVALRVSAAGPVCLFLLTALKSQRGDSDTIRLPSRTECPEAAQPRKDCACMILVSKTGPRHRRFLATAAT